MSPLGPWLGPKALPLSLGPAEPLVAAGTPQAEVTEVKAVKGLEAKGKEQPVDEGVVAMEASREASFRPDDAYTQREGK